MMCLRLILLLMMLALPAHLLRADLPATQPAVTERDTQLRHWVMDLASPEAPTRQLARLNLMALKPSELPDLKRVCAALVPLTRAQIESLKEIVGQLYLAGEVEKARNDGTAGFVGVRLGLGVISGQQREGTGGIVVYRRIIGFVGYRTLQDGDIIIGLQEAPDVRMGQVEDFIQAVASRRAGDKIQLRVIRAGRELTIPITLDPRPEWVAAAQRLDRDDPADLPYQQLVDQAMHFWTTSFGLGLDPELPRENGF